MIENRCKSTAIKQNTQTKYTVLRGNLGEYSGFNWEITG